MRLQTTQITKWRQIQKLDGVLFLDTTVKTGDPVFAPTWDIVMGVKSGKITPEEYTVEYTRLMRESYKNNPGRWLSVCQLDRVCIACYCPPDTFCHRHLLKSMFAGVCKHHGIPFLDDGEFR